MPKQKTFFQPACDTALFPAFAEPYICDMDMLFIAMPLLLVIDPFGNLPFVLAVLGRLPAGRYLWTITREMLIATLVLASFALAGQRLLGWFGIEQATLHVAGGVVLFLIALKMIFASAAGIFDEQDVASDDPVAVPIAMPSVAGPSAIATVLFFASRSDIRQSVLLGAIVVAIAITLAVFAAGRPVASWLGQRGLTALEKLTGMLLCIMAVDMILDGLRQVFSC